MSRVRPSVFSHSAGRAVAAMGLAGTAACLTLPLVDPGLFTHLSAGRWIARHGALPRADWLSHTLAGAPWIDAEWLVQLIFHGAERAAGGLGLWGLKLAFLGGAAALLWKTLALYGVRPPARGIGLFAWALALGPGNDLSPQNVSILLLLCVWFYWEARRLGRFKPPGLVAEAAAHLAVFALWANCHPGFLYGLGLLGLFTAGAAAERSSPRPLLIWAAAAGGALINPYGLVLYRTAWEHFSAMGDLDIHAREWQRSVALDLGRGPFWAVLVTALTAVLIRYPTRLDVRVEHLAALILLSLSAAGRPRTAAYFVTVAIPIAASALRPLQPRWIKRLLLAAAAAAAWGFFAPTAGRLLSKSAAPNYAGAPTGAASFLHRERAALGKLKLFNTWSWGGYLGWRLGADYPVFADDRYLFNSLLRDKHRAARSPAAFAFFLRERGIDLAVIERETALERMPIPLKYGRKLFHQRPCYLRFFPTAEWALVYWDSRGTVFVRRRAVGAGWLAGKQYRHYRPDDLLATRIRLRHGLITLEEVGREVERFARDATDGKSAEAARRWFAKVSDVVPADRGL